ncbi:MAG: Lrp/AsnC family transcriptional regulator [Pseudomonadota bacterium]
MLDTFDLAILRALQDDASLTNAELSERVHLSPSQCSRRRAALEKSGVIRGYRAELDATKLGLGIEAITRVTLSAHGTETADEFTQALMGLSEVVEASIVTGDADYVLRIRAASLEALAEFIHRRLLPLSAVSQVRSDIVLRQLKRTGTPI